MRVCPQREVTERITLLKKNIAVNPERVQELVEKGVLKPDTLKKRAKALEDFGNFLAANHNLSLYEALANPGLEGFLMVFCEIKEVEVLKYQVGAHFKALVKGVLMAVLKSFEHFFAISNSAAAL